MQTKAVLYILVVQKAATHQAQKTAKVLPIVWQPGQGASRMMGREDTGKGGAKA